MNSLKVKLVGYRTSILAISLALISLGGYIFPAYSLVFFYLSIIAIIVFGASMIRAVKGLSNRLMVSISFIIVISSLVASYNACNKMHNFNFADPQSDIHITFKK